MGDALIKEPIKTENLYINNKDLSDFGAKALRDSIVFREETEHIIH